MRKTIPQSFNQTIEPAVTAKMLTIGLSRALYMWLYGVMMNIPAENEIGNEWGVKGGKVP